MADFSASDSVILRRCKTCRRKKPLADFYLKTGRGRVTHLRYDTRCRACHGKKAKKYQKAHAVQVAEYKRKWYERTGRRAVRETAWRKFNGTWAAYDLQLHSQNESCAICLRRLTATEDRFAFDHDHATGLARGVLCPACNGGLGSFRDSPKLLRAAIAYLAEWAEQHAGVRAVNGL